MENLDEIYNQALQILKQGHSKEEVLLKYPNFAQQLSPLLNISSLLITLPKNSAPQPAMQRKYVFISGKRAWLAWLHVSKFAGVSMSVVLLLSAFVITGYAAFNSVPGQALFPVKKTAEQAQFLLAYNQEDKANIQLSIAKQRLSDAQQIFNDPQSNVDQKEAALSELSAQASTAVAEVTTVTQTNPTSVKSTPLLSSLEDISNQQRTLLSQIKPDAQITELASNALKSLNDDSQKISQIKEHVAIANNEQSLAKLTANPNSVAVLGDINKISNNQITVEKTTFNITSETSIKDSDGNSLTVESLTPKTKVNVVGTQNANNLVAEQILVTTVTTADSTTTASTTATSTQGQVKGDSTQIASGVKEATSSIAETLKKYNSGDKQASSTNDSSNSATATGSFILENPAPLFYGK